MDQKTINSTNLFAVQLNIKVHFSITQYYYTRIQSH